jgi:transcriptional regulator EpsA
MALLGKLSGNQQDQFLSIMFESLTVDRRSQLCLWLQGDFQRFLPHELLMVVIGDFAADRLKVEVLSSVPGDPNVGACRNRENLQSISEALFGRWKSNGRRMLAFDGPWAHMSGVDCSSAAGETGRIGPFTMAHGLRDERSGEDALYIALRSDRPFDDHQRKMFTLLMPNIDHACRRVVALAGGHGYEPHASRAALAIPDDDSGLSAREVEILGWVRAGKTNQEIGMILGISPFTVKNHMQRIFRKIDVINRTQAVAKFEGYRRAAQ